MTEQEKEVFNQYTVNCYHCRNPFNAMEADWCSCLVSARTMVCPSCLTCFCQAPQSVKMQFWSNAPQSLWEKKLKERSVPLLRRDDPEPLAVTRPLVLVAEDEGSIQAVAAAAIESLGYSLLLAGNGEEAVDLAKRYTPDLIITDALMPKMDGREVCRRLKESPETAHIKIVIMTSTYTARKYKAEAMKHFKADDYLAKPVDFKTLRDTLTKFLS